MPYEIWQSNIGKFQDKILIEDLPEAMSHDAMRRRALEILFRQWWVLGYRKAKVWLIPTGAEKGCQLIHPKPFEREIWWRVHEKSS